MNTTVEVESDVDLAQLGGGSSFNPYPFERHGAWILLPAAVLFFVFLHLQQIRIGSPQNNKEPK